MLFMLMIIYNSIPVKCTKYLLCAIYSIGENCDLHYFFLFTSLLFLFTCLLFLFTCLLFLFIFTYLYILLLFVLFKIKYHIIIGQFGLYWWYCFWKLVCLRGWGGGWGTGSIYSITRLKHKIPIIMPAKASNTNTYIHTGWFNKHYIVKNLLPYWLLGLGLFNLLGLWLLRVLAEFGILIWSPSFGMSLDKAGRSD